LSSNRRYFAARHPLHVGEALTERLENLLKGGNNNHDCRDQWATAYEHYYGENAPWGGITYALSRGGQQGELLQVRVNKSRSFIKAFIALVTAAKVTWRTKAKNGDSGAAASTSIGQNLLEDFWSHRNLERLFVRWSETAEVFARGHAVPLWDPRMGPPLARQGDTMLMQGDINLRILPPWDVWRDPALKSPEDVSWQFVVTYENVFDLAKYHRALADRDAELGKLREDKLTPEQWEDAILSAEISDKMDPSRRCRERDSSELVPVWHFFHRKSPALPFGRHVSFLSSSVVLSDQKLTEHYKEVPVYDLYADEKLDSAEGWTSSWDGLGVQELQDSIQSALATNVTSLGNPSVAVTQGTTPPNGDELGTGFKVFEVPPGGQKPEVLQLAEFPSDVFKLIEHLDAAHMQMMGLNDTALGNPKSAQMNAQAFAVLASMAVQQASPFQTAAFGALAKLGKGILQILSINVQQARQVRITGESSEALYAVRDYSGKDLEAIEAVEVTIGDAMEQTPAGRAQILQELRNIPGAIQSAEQVYQVLTTGRMEHQLRAARDGQNLIQAEYQMLQRGEAPVVHTSQDHLLHYRENAAVLLNPDVLRNPGVIRLVQDHLDQHYLEYYGVHPGGPGDPARGIPASPPDPLRLGRQRFLLGQDPAPPMPPAPAVDPATGLPLDPAAAGALPMGGEAAPPPEPGAPEGPAGASPLGPPMPPAAPVEMPPNPMTGQPFDAATVPIQ
jgi:hypothetical protein